MDDRIVIEGSRTKLALVLVAALAFVVLGVALWLVADVQERYPPLVVRGTGALVSVFFGLAALYAVIKLFDRSPGLVLDREGIIDDSSALAVGRVPWRDIRDISTTTVSGQRFLTLSLHDPEPYLRRGNPIKRFFVQLNHRMYGSPVFISATGLKATLEEIEGHLERFHARHGGDPTGRSDGPADPTDSTAA